VVALLDARVTHVHIEIRHPDASQEHPVIIHISPEGSDEVHLVLATPEWKRVTVPLGTTWRTWTRQMHRLQLEADSDVSSGLQMRPLDVVY
jgi:hypothetical protein